MEVSFELGLKDWIVLARVTRKIERQGILSRGGSMCKGTGSCLASGEQPTLWEVWWEGRLGRPRAGGRGVLKGLAG